MSRSTSKRIIMQTYVDGFYISTVLLPQDAKEWIASEAPDFDPPTNAMFETMVFKCGDDGEPDHADEREVIRSFHLVDAKDQHIICIDDAWVGRYMTPEERGIR